MINELAKVGLESGIRSDKLLNYALEMVSVSYVHDTRKKGLESCAYDCSSYTVTDPDGNEYECEITVNVKKKESDE